MKVLKLIIFFFLLSAQGEFYAQDAGMRRVRQLHQGRFSLGYEDFKQEIKKLKSGVDRISYIAEEKIIPQEDEQAKFEEVRDGFVLIGGEDKVADISSLGRNYLLSGGGYAQPYLRLWDLRTGKSYILGKHRAYISGIDFIDEERFVTVGYDMNFKYWDLKQGFVESYLIKMMDTGVTSVAVRDGRHFATSHGFAEHSVKFWDFVRDKVYTLYGHKGVVYDVEFLLDGRIVSAGKDKTVRVWNLEKGWVNILYGHTDTITSVEVTPEGKIVSAGDDGTIRIWDLRKEEVKVLKWDGKPISALLIYSPDYIITGRRDGAVLGWNLKDGSVKILGRHQGHVSSLSKIPGYGFASAGYDGMIRIFKLE